MTNEQFVFWLKGFMDSKTEFANEDFDKIKKKLGTAHGYYISNEFIIPSNTLSHPLVASDNASTPLQSGGIEATKIKF